MLGDANVSATIPVKDMAQAKEFYGGTLGLQVAKERESGVVYASGSTRLFLYESGNGGTNQGTSATWDVEDVKATAEELKQKGVSFEKYDMPGVTHDGDIHNLGHEKAAWFKDPSGNILCIGEKE